jgi:hypothetical protein
MPYAAFKETYFKQMMKAAKGGTQVSYAFGFDKESGQHTFVIDDALDPQQLFAKVKSEKGTSQGSFGKARMEGSALVLTPDKKIAGLRKHVLGLAKEGGWLIKQYKVAGEEEEAGGTPESGEKQGSVATPPGATPPPPGVTEPGATPEQAETAETEGEDDGSNLSPEELNKAAASIEKGVAVWMKSVASATKELRKLQKAVLDLKDPRSAPVIKGLESILKRLDTVDEEAEAAAAAARAGDAKGFDKARDVLVAKLKNIESYVKTDELIRDADTNPLVDIRISETLGASISAILRVLG